MTEDASNTVIQTGLGSFARLPLELREQLWDLVYTSAVSRASWTLRREILSRLDLTFEIAGTPYSVSGEGKLAPAAWPTEIRVHHQGAEFTPLHPAFFDVRSVNQDRLDCFVAQPLYLYRSLTVKIKARRRRDNFHEDLRACNCILFLSNIFNTIGKRHKLPPTAIKFIHAIDAGVWINYRWKDLTFGAPVQPPFDRSHPINDTYWQELSWFWICLRALATLRHFSILTVTCPAEMEEVKEWPVIAAEMHHIEITGMSNVPFGRLKGDRMIQSELDMRIVCFEMWLDRTYASELLRKERYAFWSDSYQEAAQRRLRNALFADGRRPRLVHGAGRKLEQQRLLTKIYNPLGQPSRAVYAARMANCIDEGQKALRKSVGVDAETHWSPAAWFRMEECKAFDPVVPQYGTARFKHQLARCQDSLKEEKTECVPWRAQNPT